MSTASMALLVDALQHPERLGALRPGQWDLVIRQARQADVLARLAAEAQHAGCWDAIPLQPRMHLASAHKLASRQHTELRHEVLEIERALQTIGLPAVLLKGAAYALAGLGASRGRMVSDVDILVPRERLADVESALMMAGWVSTNRDAYDQHYYRTWMHELPPLRHMRRGSVLDVHHAILPLTARFKPDTEHLLQSSVAVGGREGIRVLGRADMVLHSAAHLFHEGELEMGFRGLVDLDALLREFAQSPDFWNSLLQRASELDLEWPLFQALRYTGRVWETPVPPRVIEPLQERLGAAPWRLRLMDALYLRALRPDHALASDGWTPLARWALYLRGHWLRMPPGLLVVHLLRKLLSSVHTPKARDDQVL
jgi:hypothetical protein